MVEALPGRDREVPGRVGRDAGRRRKTKKVLLELLPGDAPRVAPTRNTLVTPGAPAPGQGPLLPVVVVEARARVVRPLLQVAVGTTVSPAPPVLGPTGRVRPPPRLRRPVQAGVPRPPVPHVDDPRLWDSPLPNTGLNTDTPNDTNHLTPLTSTFLPKNRHRHLPLRTGPSVVGEDPTRRAQVTSNTLNCKEVLKHDQGQRVVEGTLEQDRPRDRFPFDPRTRADKARRMGKPRLGVGKVT